MSLTINHQTNDISATGAGSVTIGGSAVGSSGYTHLSTITADGTNSSWTFDNIADYNHHLLIVSAKKTDTTGNSAIYLRVGASGTTDTGNNYFVATSTVKNYLYVTNVVRNIYQSTVFLTGLTKARPTLTYSTFLGTNWTTASMYKAIYEGLHGIASAQNRIYVYNGFGTAMDSDSTFSLYGIN